MKTLKAYVEEKNSWAKMFNRRPWDLNNQQDRQDIAESIDSALSPENLCCDGELSRSRVQAKYRKLTKAAAELKALDPTVKFYEFV